MLQRPVGVLLAVRILRILRHGEGALLLILLCNIIAFERKAIDLLVIDWLRPSSFFDVTPCIGCSHNVSMLTNTSTDFCIKHKL